MPERLHGTSWGRVRPLVYCHVCNGDIACPNRPPNTEKKTEGMPCTQCEVLDVGKYSHPSYLLVVEH